MVKAATKKKMGDIIQRSKIINTCRSYAKERGLDVRFKSDTLDLLRALSTIEAVKCISKSNKVKGNKIKTLKGVHYDTYKKICDDSDLAISMALDIKKRPSAKRIRKEMSKKVTKTK